MEGGRDIDIKRQRASERYKNCAFCGGEGEQIERRRRKCVSLGFSYIYVYECSLSLPFIFFFFFLFCYYQPSCIKIKSPHVRQAPVGPQRAP